MAFGYLYRGFFSTCATMVHMSVECTTPSLVPSLLPQLSLHARNRRKYKRYVIRSVCHQSLSSAFDLFVL